MGKLRKRIRIAEAEEFASEIQQFQNAITALETIESTLGQVNATVYDVAEFKGGSATTIRDEYDDASEKFDDLFKDMKQSLTNMRQCLDELRDYE